MEAEREEDKDIAAEGFHLLLLEISFSKNIFNLFSYLSSKSLFFYGSLLDVSHILFRLP